MVKLQFFYINTVIGNVHLGNVLLLNALTAFGLLSTSTHVDGRRRPSTDSTDAVRTALKTRKRGLNEVPRTGVWLLGRDPGTANPVARSGE